MESIILLLVLISIFSILYNRVQRKDNHQLKQECDDLKKENIFLFEELTLQKSLAKTFEAGYDKAKQKQTIN